MWKKTIVEEKPKKKFQYKKLNKNNNRGIIAPYNQSCKECNEFFYSSRRSLANHLRYKHSHLSIMTYTVKYYCNGKIPICLCGCGKETTWHPTRGFAEFILGHNHPDKKTDVYECDECGKEFTGSFKERHAVSNSLTFCSAGYRNISRSSGKILERVKNSLMERHGVDASSRVPGASDKMLVTRMEKYGTLTPNSNYSSRHEDIMVECLQKLYGEVDTQKMVRGTVDRKTYIFAVDAYVPSIDTYFEMDGEFWHGLDKNSYDEIEYDEIKRRYRKDVAQNKWFAKKNMRLVRMTDKELEKHMKDNTLEQALAVDEVK